MRLLPLQLQLLLQSVQPVQPASQLVLLLPIFKFPTRTLTADYWALLRSVSFSFSQEMKVSLVPRVVLQ